MQVKWKRYNYINIYLRTKTEYSVHHKSLKLEIKQELSTKTELTVPKKSK